MQNNNSTMPENIDKIHSKLLYILDSFINFANSHNLTWFVDGGTLLGAVREGGMIPWDDDVDICMPRKDYNELCSLMYENPRAIADDLFFQDVVTDNIFLLNSRLCLDGTTALASKLINKECHKGMFIDIYPFENKPNEDDFLLLIGFLRTLHNTHVESLMSYVTLQQVLTVLNANESDKIIFSQYLIYDKFINKEFSKQAYSDVLKYNFKGLQNQVNVPIGYDEILKKWYGNDYMIPKQGLSSHVIFIDPDNDWHKYDDYDFKYVEEKGIKKFMPYKK